MVSFYMHMHFVYQEALDLYAHAGLYPDLLWFYVEHGFMRVHAMFDLCTNQTHMNV